VSIYCNIYQSIHLSIYLSICTSNRQRENVPGIEDGQLYHGQAANANESPEADTQGQNEVSSHFGGDHHSLPHLLDSLLRHDDYVHVPQSRQKGESPVFLSIDGSEFPAN